MSARSRPAPFALSLLTHGLILAWLAAGPAHEEPKSLYAQAIAPRASKLVWYDFRRKLPDVAPATEHKPAKPLRADVKSAQEIVAAAAKARRARQFVWQPAPKLELRTDLQSPNVLAIHTVRPEPPPKPKLFVPPPEAPPPSGEAPMLAAPPEIRTARNIRGDASLPAMQPAKAPPRTFVPPPAAVGNHAKPSAFGTPLPEPPALPESTPPSAVSIAIVGLSPSAKAPEPPPDGSRNAQFSAGPQPRPTGGTDSSVEGAILTVPGLLIRSGTPDAKPVLMARASPTSAANLRAAVRGSLPVASIAGPHPAIRVSSAPDPLWNGREIYAMSLQMPNITSYNGSWIIWFAERREEAGAGGVLTLPVPLRKVDPKYFPAAAADRVEGNVRLIAVIRKDGRVDAVQLLRHLDDRLDQSAQEAMGKWQFEPALRDGQPVEIDALIEIPFRLAPVPKR
ncbi:MAG TPA: TonB family protein [Bryobacteraceae bacterium]|nr:TonB family protein [Bryobacteraceae bacterium]